MTRHVLISGAGIAGPALAHQLTARGWRATVVERAPQRRDEGQNVDLRGAAKDVARRMGILDDVRAAGTREVGFRFVDDDGRPVASFPVDSSGRGDGPTAELEILRGELSRILHEHTRDTTTYRFDTTITALDDRGDHVHAVLDDGSAVDADLVVIAEGLRSRTRDLVFSDVAVRELGMYLAYLTIPREPGDDRWWSWQHLAGSRAVHLRPDNLGTTRAMLSFLSEVRGLEALDRPAQIEILRRTFADAGWVAPRILAALDDAPLYFDAIGQAVAPQWSSGRVALLGDSAFAPAPVGGGGTGLALIGAYVLAGELSVSDDVRTALARYEQLLLPVVDRAQKVPPLRLANPTTRAGIRVLQSVARVVASPVGRAVGALLGRADITPAISRFALPDYPPVAVGSSAP